jgi:gluconokinase
MRSGQTAIVMGVSGCGKTTIAQALARELGWTFLEGDAFHPLENRAKMSRGIPLTDADRQPWLQGLRREIEAIRRRNGSVVLACSALKRQYRQILGDDATIWIYLQGDFATIQQRLEARSGHFMTADLLQSQFEALEEPETAIALDISQPVEQLLSQLLVTLQETQT